MHILDAHPRIRPHSSAHRRIGVRRNFRQCRLIEVLESRLLLSTAHLTPDFIVSHPNVIRPDAINSPTGFTPAMIRKAYGFDQAMFGNVVGDGTGETIAIVDAFNDPTIVADLHAFDVQFGLPDPTLVRLNQTGGTLLPGTDPAGRGNSWALETSMDVEWAHVAAPGARIVLIMTNSDSTPDLMAGVKEARAYPGVSVVSLSWGGNELSTDPISNTVFTTPAGHVGITFLAASGDNGAFGTPNNKIVGYPAASPNVVAVGGTTLTTDGSGTYISETGWGNGNRSFIEGGSGGGVSRFEAQPAYQKGVVTQSTSFRALPDVSIVADPNMGVAVFDSWDSPSSPWTELGGTSLSTPLWAGIIAVADQGRAITGLQSLDGGTQTLPGLYSLSSADFHDVTSGNNGYAAGTGYDLVTGRGSPIVNKVVTDLAALPGPLLPTPIIGRFALSATSVLAGKAVVLTASNLTDTVASIKIKGVKFYRESNGIPGLQIGSDKLLGTAVKSGTSWKLTSATTGLLGQNYTYYAVVTDTTGGTATATAALTIVSPTIGSLVIGPDTVNPGTKITLTAGDVTEALGGVVTTIKFYREANGIAGLQATGLSADLLIGTGVKSGATWSIAASTTGFAPGDYTYYAVATDKVKVSGPALSIVLQIVLPVV